MGNPTSLSCSRCGKAYSADALLNLCNCGGPLLVNDDFSAIQDRWRKVDLEKAPADMWRYEPVLPASRTEAVSLGEGWTPLLRAHTLGQKLGAENIWIKDEGQNPTDSFKARGLCCAVTMARKLGAKKLAIPSAGNAASALSAYAAAASLEAHIFMPRDVPQ